MDYKGEIMQEILIFVKNSLAVKPEIKLDPSNAEPG